MRSQNICIILLTLLFLQLWTPARAISLPQGAEQKSPQSQRDIRIMEKVLKKLVLESNSKIPGNRLQSIYLPGYGVLFEVQISDYFYLATQELELQKRYQILAEKKSASKDNLLSVYVDARPQFFAEDSVRFLERIKKIRTDLQRFYTDFASAARSLKSEEKISIHIRFPYPTDWLRYMESNPGHSRLQEIRSVAQVADLQKYRLGTCTAEALLKKIVIEEKTTDAAKNDLDIIAGIFDAALQSDSDSKSAFTRRSTRSLYIDGFGAVIITETGTRDGISLLQALEHYDKAKAIALGAGKSAHRTQQENEPDMDHVITEILELTGQYGHTLRCVKDQEWVVITLIDGSDFTGLPENRYYVQVRKADVEKYRKEELNFNQFKQRARIWKK